MQSPHTDKQRYTRFPDLEVLALDFCEWRLGSNEEAFVSCL